MIEGGLSTDISVEDHLYQKDINAVMAAASLRQSNAVDPPMTTTGRGSSQIISLTAW